MRTLGLMCGVLLGCSSMPTPDAGTGGGSASAGGGQATGGGEASGGGGGATGGGDGGGGATGGGGGGGGATGGGSATGDGGVGADGGFGPQQLAAEFSIAARGDVIEVFGFMQPNRLEHRRREADGGWTPQTTLPFAADSKFYATASWGPDRVDLAYTGSCQGQPRAVCQAFWANGAWSPAYSLGAPAGLAVVTAASSAEANHLGVNALLADGGVVYTAWNGSSWSGWSRVPFSEPTYTVVRTASRTLANGARSTVALASRLREWVAVNRLDGIQTAWGAETSIPYGFEPPDYGFATVRGAPGGGWLSVYVSSPRGVFRRNGALDALGPETALPVPASYLLACTSNAQQEICLVMDGFTYHLRLVETDGVNYRVSPAPPFE